MKYYITYPITEKANDNDYKIVKVNEADETSFLKDYGHLVIASGSTQMEALLNFGQRKTYPA